MGEVFGLIESEASCSDLAGEPELCCSFSTSFLGTCGIVMNGGTELAVLMSFMKLRSGNLQLDRRRNSYSKTSRLTQEGEYSRYQKSSENVMNYAVGSVFKTEANA